jgi:uncharacterized protein
MGLIRLILAAVAVFLVYVIVRKISLQYRAGRKSLKPSKMVQCNHCGIYLPREEALINDNGIYCCNEHRISDSKE